MEENLISPWDFDKDNDLHSSINKTARLSHSLIKYEPKKVDHKEQKTVTCRSIPKKSHKQKLIQIKTNLAQSCINLNIKGLNKKAELSPVVSPKINRKVKSILKLQAKKLEGQELNFPFKQSTMKMPQIPLKQTPKPSVPKQKPKKNAINSKQLKSPLHSGVKSSRKKIQTHSRIYKNMLADQFVLLNEKIENIFSSTRSSNKIRLNINKILSSRGEGNSAKG